MNALTIVRALIRAKREITREIHQLKHEARQMALDLSKLSAAVDRATKATEALVAAHGVATDLSVVQQTIDNHAAALDAESSKAEAAVAPAA